MFGVSMGISSEPVLQKKLRTVSKEKSVVTPVLIMNKITFEAGTRTFYASLYTLFSAME